ATSCSSIPISPSCDACSTISWRGPTRHAPSARTRGAARWPSTRWGTASTRCSPSCKTASGSTPDRRAPGSRPGAPTAQTNDRLAGARARLHRLRHRPPARLPARVREVPRPARAALRPRRPARARPGPARGPRALAVRACPARAGLRSLIFAYARASAPKLLHMAATTADLVLYEGVYDDLITHWDRLVESRLFFDCGASRNAYKHEGKKTIGYEIAEQSGWRPPDVVVAPVAVGETFIAAARGCREVGGGGWIPRVP